MRPPQALLPVADLGRALAFYASLPDFALEPHPPVGGIVPVTGPGGVRLLLAAPGANLCPWAGVPVSGPGAFVYLHRPDLDQLAAALQAEGQGRALASDPYPGYRQLTLTDPDGYQLAFWEPLPLDDQQVIALYRSGPDRLQAVLARLAGPALDQPWAPGKWTHRQIIHHLVDSDLATFQVLRTALALPGRVIQADLWDPGQWMAGLDCHRRPVEPAAALFAASRAWLLEAALHLPDGLDRWVAWPSGYRAAVRDLLRQAGGHALHHILQLEAAGGY